MNQTVGEAVALASALRIALNGYEQADVALCPPFVALGAVAQALKGSHIAVGGQNLHWEASGAYTGEVSGPMLQAAGAALVIVGHSERRSMFGETDEHVARKLGAALGCGLGVILCVGETLDEREANATFDVVRRQVNAALAVVEAGQTSRLTIAYEPVWAIGTGRNATPEQAEEVHGFLRTLLAERFGQDTAAQTRIQYGGSVKPANVKDLMACPNVDGALVGGASLKAEDFTRIVKFAER
jgi:triosephosphate isomerase